MVPRNLPWDEFHASRLGEMLPINCQKRFEGDGLMRLAVLRQAFNVLPVDMYISQTSLVGNRFSTRLNIIPFREDAVLTGGRIRVRMDRQCIADISLRRAWGLKLP